MGKLYVQAVPPPDLNKNTSWFMYPGVWTTYILILFFSWLFVLAIFGCTPGTAWTTVNLCHFLREREGIARMTRQAIAAVRVHLYHLNSSARAQFLEKLLQFYKIFEDTFKIGIKLHELWKIRHEGHNLPENAKIVQGITAVKIIVKLLGIFHHGALLDCMTEAVVQNKDLIKDVVGETYVCGTQLDILFKSVIAVDHVVAKALAVGFIFVARKCNLLTVE
eukprot:Gb_20127 [translate_table: standard]